MKKKLFFTGMLVCVLAFGMTVVGCGDKEEENTDPKTIRITGLAGKSGEVEIMLFSGVDGYRMIAHGEGQISGSSVGLSLYKYTDEEKAPTRWTGNGAYYLTLWHDDASYLFTDGKTFEQLGVYGEEDIAKAPKYSITATTSAIPFSKFQKTPE